MSIFHSSLAASLVGLTGGPLQTTNKHDDLAAVIITAIISSVFSSHLKIVTSFMSHPMGQKSWSWSIIFPSFFRSVNTGMPTPAALICLVAINRRVSTWRGPLFGLAGGVLSRDSADHQADTSMESDISIDDLKRKGGLKMKLQIPKPKFQYKFLCFCH